MLRRMSFASLAFAIVFGICSFAIAQGRGGMGGTSGFGSTGFGGSGFGGMGMSSMGRSGFGSSGFGSTGFGGMGMGSSGFGGMGMGSMGMGSGSMFGSGFGNTGFGNTGMFGGQRGTQAFIGRDSGDMAAVFNQMGRASTQFFNQMNRNMRGGGQFGRNRQNRNNNNNASAQKGPASDVRVKLTLGFTPSRPTPSALANTVRTRLATTLDGPGITPPEVTIDGGIVVLRGVAASENQRAVLERLVMLEPGVMGVRNEMTVAGSEGQE